MLQNAMVIKHSLCADAVSVMELVHPELTHLSLLSRAALEPARVDDDSLMLT